MKNLLLRKLLTILPLGLMACASEAETKIPSEGPHNILYILVDDMGYGDVNLGLEGLDRFNNPYIKTPHLAKLASQSLVFTDHYAASPVCSPSRAGLITGRTPTRANINRWIEDLKFDGNEYLHGEEVTIAEICLEAGYETAIYGKWHLNGADWLKKENWEIDGSFPNQQGFQNGMVSKENPHLTPHLKSNSQKNPGDFFSVHGELYPTLKGYTSAILTDSALSWLEGRDVDKPFFLYLPYDAVHERIYNPDAYDEMYDTGDPNKDVYYANVTFLDHHIGRLMDGLDELGLAENTIVFFSSDNGPEIMRAYYGAWRSYGTSWPLFGQKRSLYEGGIRVPGMVRWPGKIEHGISSEPNSTLDVLPTICELTGVELPSDREIDGASMLGHLLKGTTIERSKPLYWQYEYPECCQVVGETYDSRWDGTLWDPDTYRPNASVRMGDYVLRGIYQEKFREPAEFVLYNVAEDPGEEHELSESKPEIFEEMKHKLLDIYRSAEKDRRSLN